MSKQILDITNTVRFYGQEDVPVRGGTIVEVHILFMCSRMVRTESRQRKRVCNHEAV